MGSVSMPVSPSVGIGQVAGVHLPIVQEVKVHCREGKGWMKYTHIEGGGKYWVRKEYLQVTINLHHRSDGA